MLRTILGQNRRVQSSQSELNGHFSTLRRWKKNVRMSPCIGFVKYVKKLQKMLSILTYVGIEALIPATKATRVLPLESQSLAFHLLGTIWFLGNHQMWALCPNLTNAKSGRNSLKTEISHSSKSHFLKPLAWIFQLKSLFTAFKLMTNFFTKSLFLWTNLESWQSADSKPTCYSFKKSLFANTFLSRKAGSVSFTKGSIDSNVLVMAYLKREASVFFVVLDSWWTGTGRKSIVSGPALIINPMLRRK